MDNIKNLKKVWLNSLGFLDNCYINSIIVVILLLYTSELFENINISVGNLYQSGIIRVIILLLIVYISQKDTTIAILLAITYVISLQYKMYNENFISQKPSSINLQDIKHEIKKELQEEIEEIKESMEPSNMMEPPMPPSGPAMGGQSGRKPKEYFMEPPMPPSGPAMGGQSGRKPEHFFPLKDSSNEHFIPLMYNDKDFNINTASKKKQIQVQVKEENLSNVSNLNNSNLNNSECLNNYTPRFEEVGDVCSPVATFQNELNAQGLNFPEGFDSTGMGSPLN